MEQVSSETPIEIRARGPMEQFLSRGVTILSGEDLAAGTALGKVTASGKYVAYDDDGTDDGRRVCVGILAEPCDASGGDKLAGMYTKGTFYYDQLTGMDANAVADLNGRLVGNELQIN